MESFFSFIFYVAQAVYSLISRKIIFFSLKVQNFIFNLTWGICGNVLFIIIANCHICGVICWLKRPVTFLLNISLFRHPYEITITTITHHCSSMLLKRNKDLVEKRTEPKSAMGVHWNMRISFWQNPSISLVWIWLTQR